DDPLGLAPLGEENAFSVVATRAYILARRKELADAVDLLLRVVAVRADVPYLAWAEKWLAQGGARMFDEAALDEHVVSPMAGFLKQLPSGALAEDDPRRENVASAITILITLRELYPQHAQLVFLHGALLRRLGKNDEALRLAVTTFEQT